jgi:sulfatase maturation enzyme AslB (radical SAM superfamily)
MKFKTFPKFPEPKVHKDTLLTKKELEDLTLLYKPGPIKAKIYEVEIEYKCNWKCSYCSVKTHTKKVKPLEDIIAEINSYDLTDSTVILSGGEPTFNPIVVQWFLLLKKRINFKLNINTNGRFFMLHRGSFGLPVKSLWSDLWLNLDTIRWHVSEDLKDIPKNIIEWGINSLEGKVKEDSYTPSIIPLIVVTNDNVKNLDSFIAQWKSLTSKKICIIPASDPYRESQENLLFDSKLYQEILNKHSDVMNPESILRFKTKNKSFELYETDLKVKYIENYLLKGNQCDY